MKSILVTVLAAMNILVSSPAFTADLNPEAITQIFSGKTVEGYHHKRDFSFKRHFSSDGKIIGVSEKKGKRTGMWGARKNELCLQWDGGKNKCRMIKKDGDVVRQFNKKGNKNTVTYLNFTDGNDL